jgi:uncharacterized membrane protein
MLIYPLAYIASLAAFLAADGIWLSIMAPRVYRPAIGHLMADSFALSPAIAFYALYGIGLVAFAVLPGLASGKLMTAALYGALFGLVAYATYDLTNQATLRDWPLNLTLIDMAWGAFASGIAAMAGFAACSWLAVKS